MKILNESSQFLTLTRNLILIAFLAISSNISAQEYSFLERNIQLSQASETVNQEDFPNPKAVMRQSMLIPGWGQITNKQVWKVPIVYGLLGGLTFYSTTLTKDYHDYRAAYYNSTSTVQDFRFGSTPAYLAGANTSSLLNQRNFLRNRRDFIYVTIALAYILNFVDAYVFAHLRPFDVSDDLTLNRNWESTSIDHMLLDDIPALSLKISLTR